MSHPGRRNWNPHSNRNEDPGPSRREAPVPNAPLAYDPGNVLGLGITADDLFEFLNTDGEGSYTVIECMVRSERENEGQLPAAIPGPPDMRENPLYLALFDGLTTFLMTDRMPLAAGIVWNEVLSRVDPSVPEAAPVPHLADLRATAWNGFTNDAMTRRNLQRRIDRLPLVRMEDAIRRGILDQAAFLSALRQTPGPHTEGTPGPHPLLEELSDLELEYADPPEGSGNEDVVTSRSDTDFAATVIDLTSDTDEDDIAGEGEIVSESDDEDYSNTEDNCNKDNIFLDPATGNVGSIYLDASGLLEGEAIALNAKCLEYELTSESLGYEDAVNPERKDGTA